MLLLQAIIISACVLRSALHLSGLLVVFSSQVLFKKRPIGSNLVHMHHGMDLTENVPSGE